MFQRRHYEAIAKVCLTSKTYSMEYEKVVNALVDMFKEDNPNFDEKRFLERIGWQ